MRAEAYQDPMDFYVGLGFFHLMLRSVGRCQQFHQIWKCVKNGGRPDKSFRHFFGLRVAGAVCLSLPSQT